MHGLINGSIQCFLTDTYGGAEWRAIAARAGIASDGFEAMLTYEASLTWAVLDAAAARLETPRAMLLEDLGTYLVSHPNVAALRRLLRFGGDSFVEFLHSLDELHDRARLAVPDLDLPVLELVDNGHTDFTLHVRYDMPGFGHVLIGILRAMADDYGALVCLDYRGARHGVETIGVEVIELAFASGRDFALAAPGP